MQTQPLQIKTTMSLMKCTLHGINSGFIIAEGKLINLKIQQSKLAKLK
jgi:hypothetical protein